MLTPDFDEWPCGLAVVNDDGTVLSVNAELCRMVGRDAAQLQGAAIARLFPKAASLLYQTYVFPALKMSGRIDEVSISLAHAQGERLDVLMSATRRDDEQGGVVRCVFMQLQERKRLEYQLLTAKRAADEAPGLLFQLRKPPLGSAVFTYVTDAVRVLFDVAPAAAMQSAEAVWAALHPDDVDAVRASLDASAQAMQPWRCDCRVSLPSGEGWREIHATPRREADGTILWNGYVADITERRHMEAQLREKESAERTSAAKSAFLARMSHELRTPLNGILGFARLMQAQDAGNLREDQRQRLGLIESAGNSLLLLINEVLEISRIESGHDVVEMADVPLHDVVCTALQLAEPLAQQRQVQCQVESPGAVWVRADAHRLQQVLLNLLSNAIKYGPQGGVVKVLVQPPLPLPEHAEPTQGVRVTVQDQGPGLSPAQQAQLFQPFNRLGAERSRIEGTGLGLVITQGLVRQMGGQLQVNSEPGQGAAFTVSLQPGQAASKRAVAPAVAAAAVVTEPDAMWQPRRVLYVEDNPVNAILMQAVFEDCEGYVLDVVDSGRQALALVQHTRPDALLLDMHLPDTDGPTLLRALRSEPGLDGVPAIAVSADAMPDDIDRALAAGFADYWTKPLDIALVLPTLHALLASSGPGGGTIQG